MKIKNLSHGARHGVTLNLTHIFVLLFVYFSMSIAMVFSPLNVFVIWSLMNTQ